jgi:hypothetical protein
VQTTDWGSTLKLPKQEYILREGSPVGTVLGFKNSSFYTVDDFNVVNGVWTLKEGVPDMDLGVSYAQGALNAYPRPEGQNAIPGMIKFDDVNGDGVLDLGDATDVGHIFAEHTGGFNINANYKGIDFAAGFTYQIGGKVYNANAMNSWIGNKNTDLGWNRLAYTADVWKMYNTDSNGDLVAITDPDELRAKNAGAEYALPFAESGLVLDQFVENASYLRLNTLTLGYTIPKVLTKKIGISNLRVYFTGGNLFCLTGYNGLDPDVNTKSSGTSGYQTPGYDWNSYPRARTYTFGLNVAF